MEKHEELLERIKGVIRDVPDFPQKGIMFKDITPILQHAALCEEMLEAMVERLQNTPVDAVAAIEARGFLFGFLLAVRLGIPFIPIRKAGKLPYKTVSYQYTLEYGIATVEMHADAITPGMHVLVHDDLLATGGTASAAASLIKQQGGEVAGFSFLVELEFLNGAKSLSHFSPHIDALIKY